MISVKHFRNFEFDLQSAASESACIRSEWDDKQTLTHLTIEIMFINENCFLYFIRIGLLRNGILIIKFI